MPNDAILNRIEALEDEIAANERFFCLNREAGNLTNEDIATFNEQLQNKSAELERLKASLT